MRYRRVLVLSAVSVALLCGVPLGAQGMHKKTNLNDLPYARVKAMLANPQQRATLAKEAKANHVVLMGGKPINGERRTLKGELTGADCYLSRGLYGHDHALCAKACVAHGSPIVFLANGGLVYLVLTPRDGVPYPRAVLNDLGRANVTVVGHTLDAHGIRAIAIQSVRK